MDLRPQFKALLDSVVRETGISLKKTTAQVANYMAERAAHLANGATEDGFPEAVLAERDNVLLFAGVAAVGNAQAFDSRVLGIVQGALFIGIQALAGGLGAP